MLFWVRKLNLALALARGAQRNHRQVVPIGLSRAKVICELHSETNTKEQFGFGASFNHDLAGLDVKQHFQYQYVRGDLRQNLGLRKKISLEMFFVRQLGTVTVGRIGRQRARHPALGFYG